MKIYLDNIIFSLQKSGGISVYWYELLKRILQDKDFEPIFIDYNNKNLFRKLLSIDNSKIISNLKLPIKLIRYFNPCWLNSPTIFHSSYYRYFSSRKTTNICTVHDFTYEYFRRGLPKLIHKIQKGNAIKNADFIICISNNTKKDLFKFYPKINKKNVHVIYNGVSSAYKPIKNSLLELRKLIPFSSKKYILYVGDRLSPYKNFKLVVESSKLSNIPVVLVGGGLLNLNEKSYLNKLIGSRNYCHLNNIENIKLNILYNNALCLLYPSAYEGFGIPLIEAQNAGCPIIANNSSSIPEVVGKGAVLIDDICKENISSKLNLLINNSIFVSKIIKFGFENSKNFSWDKCYLETKNIYLKSKKYKL